MAPARPRTLAALAAALIPLLAISGCSPQGQLEEALAQVSHLDARVTELEYENQQLRAERDNAVENLRRAVQAAHEAQRALGSPAAPEPTMDLRQTEVDVNAFADVRTGMTERDVVRILGEPKARRRMLDRFVYYEYPCRGEVHFDAEVRVESVRVPLSQRCVEF